MAFRYAHIRPNLPLAIRDFEGVRSTPIRSPPVTSLARRSGLARRARAASNRILWVSIWAQLRRNANEQKVEYANRRERQARGALHGSWRGAGGGLSPPIEGRARAGRVQRSKGSTGSTRTHRRAPRGGPGGVLRTQRTIQPSWMCSFDDTWWHLRTWGGPTSTPGNWVEPPCCAFPALSPTRFGLLVVTKPHASGGLAALLASPWGGGHNSSVFRRVCQFR